MKKRVLIIFLSLLLAAATFGGLSGCTNGNNTNVLTYVLFDDNEGFLAVSGGGVKTFVSVSIPETTGGITVNRIDYEAFANCGELKKITMPRTITSILGKAFKNCTSLTSIILPAGLNSIGIEAFSGSGLTEVLLPDLTYLGLQSFALCSDLELVKFSDSLKVIESRMFMGCIKLETVVLPKELTTIEQGVFDSCFSLSEIILPSLLTSIGTRSFYSCTSLEDIDLPISLKSLDSFAFWGCTSLASVTLPDSLQSIGAFAFSGCTSLTEITLPPLLQSVGTGAFAGCTSLKTVTIEGEDFVVNFDVFNFEEVPEGFSLKVPPSLLEQYRTAEGWSDLADCISAIENDQA